jgi:hypothetical protein
MMVMAMVMVTARRPRAILLHIAVMVIVPRRTRPLRVAISWHVVFCWMDYRSRFEVGRV